MKLKWIPETYPRSGGLSAAGFYKLLGRPRLDPLTVLVRETAQNSWDARASETQPVRFAIDGCALDERAQAALKGEVFTKATSVPGGALAGVFDGSANALHIADRGTIGLGGPVRADEADPEDKYDWVDFVLNVGKANTAGQTGGTYGFGKTISYVVSSVNAVVIHSRTLFQGVPESRLIACAIGDEFTRDGKLCTGRHWWGVKSGGMPEPVLGEAADWLADAIGMAPFAPDEFGTNILIVQPDFGGRTGEEAMAFIAESVTWHLWPKLIERDGRVPMDITVGWNGVPVPIPDPLERPPLHGFAQAYREMLAGASNEHSAPGTRWDVVKVGSRRAEIGDLITIPLVQRPRADVHDGHRPGETDSPPPAAAITGVCHHVALLRSPELVVEYLEGPAPPEGGTEWAGVFKVRAEHDSDFAAAEPPTHDSWQPDLLPKSNGRTIVNTSLRRIREALDARWAPVSESKAATASSTAVVADRLAHLVRTTTGKGAGRTTKEASPKQGQRSARVTVASSGPILVDGGVATAVVLQIEHAAGTGRSRIELGVGAALDGSSSDADLDPGLRLLEYRLNGNATPLDGLTGSIDVGGPSPVEVEVVILRGPDTSVLLEATPLQVSGT